MKIFSTWSYNAVKTLFLYTDQRRFMLNQYVFKEGDEYDALYMVKSGEFEVIFIITVKKLYSPEKDFSYNKNQVGK